jgi:hypothetical protein
VRPCPSQTFCCEQAKDNGERLIVAEDQGRHPVTAGQSVAAVAAAFGLHGDTQFTQVGGVPAHRADVGVQTVGQLRPGEPGVRLKEFQQGQHTDQGMRHGSLSISGRDLSCIDFTLPAAPHFWEIT